MGRINAANLKKTIYYLKRNGLRQTWYAVRERLDERRQPSYCRTRLSEASPEGQRRTWEQGEYPVSFSILVPAYGTREKYLRELLESLRRQTYPGWELILADATEDDSVEKVVMSVKDSRIRYIRLEENRGIAENTNQALKYVSGEYAGLLDHDDILEENALHEMAVRIEEGRHRGIQLEMLYSDEDKCNGDRTEYYEPNLKEDFNLDLLLSNNYICHFLVMKRELIQELRFRPEYDGAQDYDLVLRAAAKIGRQEDRIAHIAKVLYHWRCHTGSTAENPQSKRYAYEAGRRAVQDFIREAGWKASAEETAHVGFYALHYEGSIFDSRQDVAAVGGALVYKKRIVGGRMTEEGEAIYAGLPVGYSGYLHRAALAQNASAVDIRNVRVRQECREIFRQVLGVHYKAIPGTEVFDVSLLPEDSDWTDLSLRLCRALREAGYRILYLPDCAIKLKRERLWKK
ncbi:glycosyltransferase [Acetatifactor muris]|uniref:UDP-Glc:alpha-D-GlcNAc-diphosphoundecaprenol beta-1,3-glucosyltransferase WfgD n=1 Tax=Acetatifactor muris TaxID=879566 RepID=A0A2K4ZF98_9FIRM|nr:glycosyltransferase [Acetatifactor muris]MCR2047338.1 glycosyltransferase [Acetatifactor muris]SOY29143.1 UDP-Glc:alpha-D-GlcNAc-diphosphoundecaprenol beta-1,3-glucosyltransferase WfgD [Acetatifactor muris]